MIQSGMANIYSTDLFDRVILNVMPGDSSAIINIAVEEKKFNQARIGWHWHDEYGSEEFVEILNDNLLGAGQEFLLHAQYSPERQKYEVSLKADRFFSTYLTYSLKAYFHRHERNIFDPGGDIIDWFRSDRFGAEFILGRQIERFGTVTGEIRWEEIENYLNSTGQIEKVNLRTLTIRSLVETINKYPFPTEGKRHLFYVEFASDILGGQTEYTRGFSSVESYFPLFKNINFHPGFAIGWTETEFATPLSEKFFLGGRNSFIGFRTNELAGDKMVLGSLELRYKLPYRFYLTGRYDTGEVYRSADQIKFSNLRHGFGFSIAYDSPLGPIDLAYGRAGGHPDRIYINVGLTF
jgi:outer membrane protein assembly factor BamA